jgi:hypothetical protein
MQLQINDDTTETGGSSSQFYSPWFLGSILGIAVALAFIGGGFDAYVFFFQDTLWSVPPWVHLAVKPVALLPWPSSYIVLTIITLIVLGISAIHFGSRWWLVIFSAPVFWEIWSGQIDWLVALGLLLAVLVLKKRLSPLWFGLAWLLMLSKPWIGAMALLALTWSAYRQFGWKPLVQAAGLSLGILILTFAYRPSWYLDGDIFKPLTLISRHANYSTNGAFWPWTLVAWMFVFRTSSPDSRLQRILAATSLSGPFLHLYHVSVLTATIQSKKIALILFGIGWAIVLTSLLGYNWFSLAWIYPSAYLILDWGFERARQFKQNKEVLLGKQLL